MSLVEGQISQHNKKLEANKPGKRSVRMFDQHDNSIRVLTCLAYRHRVGLLASMLVAYVALDHIGGLGTFGQILYGTLFGNH